MSSLITFGLAVCSVGLWTLRVALAARGNRLLGSSVAAAEAVVFVLAFSHVTGSLNAPLQIAIYGIGVGAGTFLGLTVDRALRLEGSRRHPKTPVDLTEVVLMGHSPHDESITMSLSPGSRSTSSSGVSSAHLTSAGDL